MYIFYFFMRAAIGFFTLNLSMRFVPHIRGSGRMVSIMALICYFLIFINQGFLNIFYLLSACYFWMVGKSVDSDRLSLTVPIGFLIFLIELIETLFFTINPELNIIYISEVNTKMFFTYKIIGFLFYARILIKHHMKLSENLRS